jgi:excisionase family DNA binding protein
MSKNLPRRKPKTRVKSQRNRQPVAGERLLFRRDEVARMLGLSYTTIVRMTLDGRLPGIKLGAHKNHRTLYRAADIYRIAGAEVG